MADSKGFFFENVIIRCGDKTVELEHVHSTSRRLRRLMELGYDMAASLELSVNSDRQVATLLGLLQFVPEDDEDQSPNADLAVESEDPVPSSTEPGIENAELRQATATEQVNPTPDLRPSPNTAVSFNRTHLEVLRRQVNARYPELLPNAVRSFAHVAGHRFWYQVLDDLARYQKNGYSNPLIEPFNEVLQAFGLSVSTDLTPIRQFLPV